MKENKTNKGAMTHNVCYDKKFRELLRQYFNSYFEYIVDLNGRCGLTRMFRKCLVSVFDINPCMSVYRRENGTLVNRLELIANDGHFNFGTVKACFDGLSVQIDFSGLK